MNDFAEGDLVEYVGDAYSILRDDARFGTLRAVPTSHGYEWDLVLTREAQAALAAQPGLVTRDEADRLSGWPVHLGEIRKVED